MPCACIVKSAISINGKLIYRYGVSAALRAMVMNIKSQIEVQRATSRAASTDGDRPNVKRESDTGNMRKVDGREGESRCRVRAIESGNERLFTGVRNTNCALSSSPAGGRDRSGSERFRSHPISTCGHVRRYRCAIAARRRTVETRGQEKRMDGEFGFGWEAGVRAPRRSQGRVSRTVYEFDTPTRAFVLGPTILPAAFARSRSSHRRGLDISIRLLVNS